MNPLQAMFDGASHVWQRERAATQMTLGKLIKALEAMPPGSTVSRIERPHSFRRYYMDLAFEPGVGMMPVDEAIKLCRGAMGKVFFGYKGGDYLMGESTPVWIAEHGSSVGERIIVLDVNGTFWTTKEDQDED